MIEQNWVLVREVSGESLAETLRGLLEAQEIPVFLNQEGAGRVYGLNIGPLGTVQILVPQKFEEDALKILTEFDEGDFEDMENQG
jgi:hypothetical protein